MVEYDQMYQQAPVNWPVMYRQPHEEMVSPLSHNMKMMYPVQQVGQPQPASLQYSAVPYVVPGQGVLVPRTSVAAPLSGSLTLSGSLALGGLVPLSGSPEVKPEAKSPQLSGSNVCSECGKAFQKPYNLKSHMKTHSTERPFKCQYCPKVFARLHDRKRHENLHGGQKNFKCEGYLRNGVTKWGCGKKFARLDALSRHFRTETGYLCIKQFMDEEKEREMAMAQPYAKNMPMNTLAPAHAPLAMPENGPRLYDLFGYATHQISLPPLLRH